jgi:hypothetical protein
MNLLEGDTNWTQEIQQLWGFTLMPYGIAYV